MKHIRTLLTVGSIAAVSLGALAIPATAGAQTPHTSCQAKLAAEPGTPDGTYPISLNGTVVNLYCAGMSTGAPKEYINLPRQGTFPSPNTSFGPGLTFPGSFNFTSWEFNGPIQHAIAQFRKIRLDITTMQVIAGDATFVRQEAWQTGFVGPYGSISGCNGGPITAYGNIDLRGTAFAVADTFWWYGYNGYANFSDGGQVVDLGNAGGCGSLGPNGGQPGPNFDHHERLQLALVPALAPGIIPPTTPPDPMVITLSSTPAGSPTAGSSVTLTANISGGFAPYSYTWKRNGVGFGGNTGAVTDTPATLNSIYTVTVLDALGNLQSSTITKTLVAPGGGAINPPAVTLAISPSLPGPPGSPVTVTATVTGGYGAFTYSWTRNGVPLVNNSPSITDAPLSFLTLYRVTVTDSISGVATATTSTMAQGTATLSWGVNYSGQLGGGLATEPSTGPVQAVGNAGVGFLTGVVSVSSSASHTLALDASGTVWAWGYNGVGQLGITSMGASSTPIRVTGLPSIAAVSAGHNGSLALDRNGGVWSWGALLFQVHPPAKVAGLSTVVAIAAGRGHNLALTADHKVYAWGDANEYFWGMDDYFFTNALGTGAFSSSTPTLVPNLPDIKAIAANAGFSLALSSDGRVYSWGIDTFGNYRDMWGQTAATGPYDTGLSQITSIAAGAGFGVALDENGVVRQWGDPHGTAFYYPFLNIQPVTQVLTGATAITAGGLHALALKADGSLHAWGDNYYGALGDGNRTSSPGSTTPVQVLVAPGARVTAFAAGSGYSVAVFENPAPQPTVTAVFAPGVTFGQNAVVTVTVTSGAGTPSGAVALAIDGGAAVSQNLSGGAAVFTVPALAAGTHTISAAYAGETLFAPSGAGGSLVVSKITPVVTWASPANINAGTPLSATQLNATASVPGTFAYTPASGTVPGPGTQTLSVTFTPTNAANYNTVTAAVQLTVNSTGALNLTGGQSVTFTDGTVSGNTTVSNGSTLTLNNSEVTGNLTVGAGGTLNLAGSSVITGNLKVEAGGTIVTSGGSVDNNLQISGASTFSLNGVSIDGNLVIQNIPASSSQNKICGVTVKQLQIQGNAVAIALGSGDGSCAGNTINGNLQIDNNTAPISVFQNVIDGNLQCSGNTAISGGGNTVTKQKQGQCAGY